jgi:flagellar basal-body rod protein FlgG
MRSLWISKTGMEAQQTQLDTISNNLANVSTNGYKRSHAVFEDLMYQNMRQAGAASSDQTELPTGLQVGLGTRAVATARNFSQGNLQQSANPLDVAIRGNGFFQIQLPDGTTGYTRDGSFQVSATGQLVTNTGYTVQPGITIPATAQSVTIGNDGTVSVVLPGQALPQPVGQIQLASFINPPASSRRARTCMARPRRRGRRTPGSRE